MRIVNARTGKPQEIPFNLGEAGRGRHLEEIKISNRPGQEPGGPDDVGYFTFGTSPPHVILTKSDPRQRGILLRINTAGAYTKGSCGEVMMKGGPAKLLAEGQWAVGDAGRIGSGPDQLWHVEGPAIFAVYLQGGEHKGYGWRYLIVTRQFEAVMLKRDELCQLIATDDRPDVVEVVREHAARVAPLFAAAQAKYAEAERKYLAEMETSKGYEERMEAGRRMDVAKREFEIVQAQALDDEVISAIALADRLEETMDAPVTTVAHFVPEGGDLRQIIAGWDIAIPASFNSGIGGVGGVESGTLVPGEKQLISASVGGGGGSRYGFTIVAEDGITRLKSLRNHRGTSEQLLAQVESADWMVAWAERCDGQVTSYNVANAGGVHRYEPMSMEISTRTWPGHEMVTPSQAEIQQIFGLAAGPLFPEWVVKWATAVARLLGAARAIELLESYDGTGRGVDAVEDVIEVALRRLPETKAEALRADMPSLFQGKGCPTYGANARLVASALKAGVASDQAEPATSVSAESIASAPPATSSVVEPIPAPVIPATPASATQVVDAMAALRAKFGKK